MPSGRADALRLSVTFKGRPVRAIPMPLNCHPPQQGIDDARRIVEPTASFAGGHEPDRATAEVVADVEIGIAAPARAQVLISNPSDSPSPLEPSLMPCAY
ncbi:MAG: hypothetical protein WDO73_02575 [Ignavibacteriota bacterium]